MIKLGYYRHWKGDIYEVLGSGVQCTGNNEGEFILYRKQGGSKFFVRTVEDFVVDDRFELLEPLDSPLQLFVETLRMAYHEFKEMDKVNPLFRSHGGHLQMKYLVGDKISLAMTLRIFGRDNAVRLLDWVNKW